MNKAIKPISFSDYMQENMKNPSYQEAYKALDNDMDVVLIEALAVAKKKGLTQKEIARRMKTTQSVISRTFSKEGNPTLKFLQKFAKAMDMSLKIQFQNQ